MTEFINHHPWMTAMIAVVVAATIVATGYVWRERNQAACQTIACRETAYWDSLWEAARPNPKVAIP